MLDTVKAASFAAHLNTKFEIKYPEGKKGINAELIEVKALEARAEDKRQPSHRSPFSIVFRTAKSKALDQSTYTMKHPVMGEMAIFLVPVGEDDKGRLYEAVFN